MIEVIACVSLRRHVRSKSSRVGIFATGSDRSITASYEDHVQNKFEFSDLYNSEHTGCTRIKKISI